MKNGSSLRKFPTLGDEVVSEARQGPFGLPAIIQMRLPPDVWRAEVPSVLCLCSALILQSVSVTHHTFPPCSPVYSCNDSASALFVCLVPYALQHVSALKSEDFHIRVYLHDIHPCSTSCLNSLFPAAWVYPSIIMEIYLHWIIAQRSSWQSPVHSFRYTCWPTSNMLFTWTFNSSIVRIISNSIFKLLCFLPLWISSRNSWKLVINAESHLLKSNRIFQQSHRHIKFIGQCSMLPGLLSLSKPFELCMS